MYPAPPMTKIFALAGMVKLDGLVCLGVKASKSRRVTGTRDQRSEVRGRSHSGNQRSEVGGRSHSGNQRSEIRGRSHSGNQRSEIRGRSHSGNQRSEVGATAKYRTSAE